MARAIRKSAMKKIPLSDRIGDAARPGSRGKDATIPPLRSSRAIRATPLVAAIAPTPTFLDRLGELEDRRQGRLV